AFFLALAPNARRYRPGFLARVLRFAVPAGLIAATGTFVGYVVAREVEELPLAEARTTATLVLFFVALWVLGILARPLNPWRLELVATMVGLFLVVLAVPALRDYFELRFPPVEVTLTALAIAALACLMLEAGWRLAGWVDRNPRLPDLGVSVDDLDTSDERFPILELLHPDGLARPRRHRDDEDGPAGS